MDFKGSIAFAISDYNLKYEDINNNIKIIPSKIIHKGQVIMAEKIAPYNIWSYEVKMTNETTIDDCLYSLLNQIMPYSTYIKK